MSSTLSASPAGVLPVRLSAAKIRARIGAEHEKARPGGICVCII
jgi:hypothetical protein